MFRRMAAGAAMVVVVALLDLPAAASFTEVKASTVIFERTTRGPATLKLATYADFGGRPADPSGNPVFTGIVGQRQGKAGRVVPFALTAAASDSAPAAYVDGSRFGCPQHGCGAVANVGASISTVELSDRGMNDPAALDRIFVVISSREPSLQYDAHGWRPIIRSLAFRFTTHADSRAAVTAGLVNGTADSDLFTSGVLVGGSAGSISAAQLPCGTVSAGRGTLSSAQGASVEATCIAGTQESSVALLSSSKTTWTFRAEAAAAGLSGTQSGRLLVIDLPRAVGTRIR